MTVPAAVIAAWLRKKSTYRRVVLSSKLAQRIAELLERGKV